MVLGLGVPVCERFFDDFINDDSVFRVHANACPVIPRLTERPVKRSVVYLEYTWISPKELVGNNTFVCQLLHFGKSRLRHIRDIHMEGIVDQ